MTYQNLFYKGTRASIEFAINKFENERKDGGE